MISRTFTCRNKDIIIRLYKTLVRPRLEYCGQVWRPHYQKDIDALEKVQKRATRMVENLKGMDYAERLKSVQLTILETRRIRADLIEVYNIVN